MLRWAPGVICDRIGSVMYMVWIEDRRLVRAHVNQMRSREDSGAASSATINKAPKQLALPLDVLLDAWDIPRPSPELQETSSGQSTSIQQTSVPLSSESPPELPAKPASIDDSRMSSPETSSSSSTSASSSSSSFLESSEFASAESKPATPVQQILRRSSRNRRAPAWFDPYQLY